jgi:hypothetical protein
MWRGRVVGIPAGTCQSWPHCSKPATDSGYCTEHGEIIYRAASELKYRRKLPTFDFEPAAMVVTHVEPTPTSRRLKKRSKKRTLKELSEAQRDRHEVEALAVEAAQVQPPTRSATLRAAILAALAGSPPLLGSELAIACDTTPQDATLKVVRARLIKDGTVLKQGSAGTRCLYSLPASA